LSISSDSVTREVPGEKTADKQAPGSTSTTSEPKGQEMTYVARISVADPRLQIDDKFVSLSPGMAVTAEIKTGSRRLISYLLSPLMKYKQESLRER